MEKYVKELFDFISSSVSPYHNVELVSNILKNFKFVELKENEEWTIESGKSYFVKRSGSSIIAIKIGENAKKFNICASHNDSPSFKLKPVFDFKNGAYIRLNTEVYGGPIISTWFDRPLSVSGRVSVETSRGVEHRLIDLSGHNFIIPSLAPHMGRINSSDLNLQNDLLPLVASSENCLLSQIKKITCFEESDKILSHDLFLYNKETPVCAGVKNEYICSPKLDDLECAFSSLEAFLEASPINSINVCAIFNNEEVGSGSNNAAASTFITDVLERLCESLHLNKYVLYANSMLVSADNAHAVHPAHPEKTDPTNGVYMNKGIVIKQSASLSYTTDSISSSEFKHILNKVEVPYQDFVNNSTIRGGSTLGHIVLEKLSISSVDIGFAQLAMHSVYETAGAKDLALMVKGLKAFYER